MKTVRKLQYGKDVITITFDEYGVLDTVEKQGVLLVSTSKICKLVLSNSDRILGGFIPEGFTKAKVRR